MSDLTDHITAATSLLATQRIAAASGRKGTAWLDSTLTVRDRGTRSLYADTPAFELVLAGGILTLASESKLFRSAASARDALTLLEKLVKEGHRIAVGFISYEASLQFLELPRFESAGTPDIHFFIYDQATLCDPSVPGEIDPGLGPVDSSLTTSIAPRTNSRILNHPKFDKYRRQVESIKKHIFEGDIYQANLTHRFEVSSRIDPFGAYEMLRRVNPSPYGAFINFGDYQVLSSSPERMFVRQGDFISTGPIKGTIPRGSHDLQDRENVYRLQNSEKDLAEHLMIVDLERNDLGRIAQTGTVKVDDLFRPESYSSVFHLTSDISATLKPNCSFADLCEAMLPGGSITGAPKRRAVEILQEIEETPRGIYTGCIGYLTEERADFNIAIRTIVHQNGLYHVHAGGAIVADSTPESEYQEMHLKARNLFRALGVEPAP